MPKKKAAKKAKSPKKAKGRKILIQVQGFPELESKIGLVLSGGAAHGAFSAGVVYELIKTKKMNFDIITANSTGALIATLAVSGTNSDMEELKKAYTDEASTDVKANPKKYGIVKPKDVLQILASNSIYDMEPLKKLIDKHIDKTRYEKILQTGKTIVFATVNIISGELEYWTIGNVPELKLSYGKINKITKLQTLKEVLLASCSEPVFTEPVRINGGDYYVDGGLREFAPVEIAVNFGVDTIYAILTTPEKRDPFELPSTSTKPATQDFGLPNNLTQMLFRTIDLFVQEVGRNDMYIGNVFRDSSQYISRLEPSFHQIIEAVKSRAEVLKNEGKLSQEGYNDLLRVTSDTQLPDPVENPFHNVRLSKIVPLQPKTLPVGDGFMPTKKDLETNFAAGQKVGAGAE